MAPTDGRAASARAAAPPDGAVSARAEAVPPFVVMEVMAQAAAQEAALAAAGSATRVVHLEVGQPAAGAPAAARAAAVAALEDPADALGYTAALGEPPLRAAIAALYGRRYGVELRPEHVAVTTGSSGAFIAAFACLWDAGDRVCCPVPGYPCYRNCLGALGARVVMLETHAGDGYAPTVAALEAEEAAAGPLAGLVLASPGNPTGRALSRAQLLDLARFCDARRIPLVVDEIYHGIGAAPVPSALEVSDSVVVVSSFSKFWCLAGWRVGFIVTRNDRAMHALERLLQNMHISAPTISQRVALAALGADCLPELAAHVERYCSNISILLHALPRLGFDELRRPDGAFYLYSECSHVLRRLGLRSSVELSAAMLKTANVAVTPGVDFDPLRGDRYVRFSVAGSTEDVREAAYRLTEWLDPAILGVE